MKNIKKITIVGMGALGLLYGSFLVDAREEVRYVMDPERLAKYRGSVFYLNGNPFYPPMISCEEAQPADLVIVAVKYPGFVSAMDTIRTSVGADTILMSVMNGISSEELLSERYGQGHLIYTGHSEVELFAGTVLRLAKKHGILVPFKDFPAPGESQREGHCLSHSA